MTKSDQPSIRDRMLAAPDMDTLVALRAESKRFNNAKPNTRSKWHRAFNLRKSQLDEHERQNAELARKLAKASQEVPS